MGLNVCIAWALGCPRSELDTACFVEYFRANGWTVVPDARQADLVVFSGCAVADSVEARSLRLLSTTRRRMRKDSLLVIFGCMCPIIGEEDLVKKFAPAICITSRNLSELDRVIDADTTIREMPEPNELDVVLREARRHFGWLDRQSARFFARKFTPLPSIRQTAWSWCKSAVRSQKTEPIFSVRVAWGCPGNCSYCGILLSMGPFSSKPLSEIAAEMKKGLALGYKTFQLVAPDVGAYGQDCSSTLPELLSTVLAMPGDYRLVLTDLNVQWTIRYPEVGKVLAQAAGRVRSIQAPVQSGSDRLLDSMRRPYHATDAIRSLNALREACPDAICGTHVMVGFPGETDNDVEQTISLLRQVPGYYFNLYKYSDRSRTEAALMPNKVPEEIKLARFRRMRKEFPSRCRPQI